MCRIKGNALFSQFRRHFIQRNILEYGNVEHRTHSCPQCFGIIQVYASFRKENRIHRTGVCCTDDRPQIAGVVHFFCHKEKGVFLFQHFRKIILFSAADGHNPLGIFRFCHIRKEVICQNIYFRPFLQLRDVVFRRIRGRHHIAFHRPILWNFSHKADAFCHKNLFFFSIFTQFQAVKPFHQPILRAFDIFSHTSSPYFKTSVSL